MKHVLFSKKFKLISNLPGGLLLFLLLSLRLLCKIDLSVHSVLCFHTTCIRHSLGIALLLITCWFGEDTLMLGARGRDGRGSFQ